MPFEIFIKDNLTMTIDDIFIEINKIMEEIISKILYQDMEKFINLIKSLNRYFCREGVDVYYSLIKETKLSPIKDFSQITSLRLKRFFMQ